MPGTAILDQTRGLPGPVSCFQQWPKSEALGQGWAKWIPAHGTLHFSAAPVVATPSGCRCHPQPTAWAPWFILPATTAGGRTYTGKVHGQVAGMGPWLGVRWAGGARETPEPWGSDSVWLEPGQSHDLLPTRPCDEGRFHGQGQVGGVHRGSAWPRPQSQPCAVTAPRSRGLQGDQPGAAWTGCMAGQGGVSGAWILG